LSYVIGIDPGCSGAIVVLESAANPVPVEWIRMPTMMIGKSSVVDGAEVFRFLRDFDTGHAFIEHVHAMPKQGVSSVFTFGDAFGSVRTAAAVTMIPMTLVTPQAWKKRAGLIGQDKDAARSRGIQLWPRWADLGKKAAGQAFADAALIARFGSAT